MYSVVMMMVLSSSPETVAFGGRRGGCEGCYGGGGCAGYACGGGNGCGGCNGGRGGLFSRGGRGHGCDGGCWGGNGCFGGGHKHGRRGNGCCGCMGQQASCQGYGGGCWGGQAVGGCWGGAMMAPQGAPAAPVAPATQPEAAPAPTPKPGAMAPAAGTIVVSLPADAKVSFDGVATASTSDVRRFATPELAAGSVANYTLSAEIVRDGQKLTTTRLVSVKAGETLEVSLSVDSFTTSLVRN